MQNQVYSRYLYRMLMEYGAVFVPEVGLFSLDYSGAAFQSYMTVLQPPSTHILYDGSATKPQDFAALLEDSGMDANLAAHTQAAVAADYKVALRQKKSFALAHFGKIENGVFAADDPETFNLYRGLKMLQVEPVSTGIKHNEGFLSDINRKRVVDKPTSFNQYLFPLLISLIALFCIGYWFTQSKPNAQTAVIAKQEAPQIQEKPIIDELAPEDTITDKDIVEVFKPEVSEAPVSDHVVPKKSEIPEKVVVPVKKAETKPVTEPSKALKASDCVIIIGSFKNSKNAADLNNKIQKKGYQTYIETHGGFRRVGIVFDCKTNDPEKYKEDIRQKINKDAWLLDEK